LFFQVTAYPQAPDAVGIEFFERTFARSWWTIATSVTAGLREDQRGLLLDTREGVLKGGDSGPAIVPGEPNKSLLVKAIRYTDENLQMPPAKGGSKKLLPEQIDHLETWVKMGAPDPRGASDEASKPETIAAKARAHWAFQPIALPEMPRVGNQRWVRTPVDAFILAKLEGRQLPLRLARTNEH
jgi:hypothetical protein